MKLVIVLINDESEESDLDDIILITVTVVTKMCCDCAYDDNEEYSSRTILSHDD